MENIQTIPLDLMLSQSVKNEIKDAVEMFMKGLMWKTGKEIEYNLSIGSVDIATKLFYDDTTKFEIVLMHVSRYYKHIDIDKIFEHIRTREIVEIRQMLWLLLSKFTTWSLARIGQNTGKFDHATVLHGKKTMGNLISKYQQYSVDYNALCGRIDESIKAKTSRELEAANHTL